MGKSLKTLKEKLMALGGRTIEPNHRDFLDLKELVNNMMFVRDKNPPEVVNTDTSGSTCSEHISLGSFALSEGDIYELSIIKCSCDSVTDTTPGCAARTGQPTCTCDTVNTCTCDTRSNQSGYWDCLCESRTDCTSYSYISTCNCQGRNSCDCVYRTNTCQCRLRNSCDCVYRTKGSTGTDCTCYNRTGTMCDCDTRSGCTCYNRTGSTCDCNTRGGASCSCNGRTDCTCTSDSWYCSCNTRHDSSYSQVCSCESRTYIAPCQCDTRCACNVENRFE